MSLSLSLCRTRTQRREGKKGDFRTEIAVPPSAKWTAFEISARIIGSIGWLHTRKNGARVGLIAD